jgi:hypothetical protein
MTKVGRLHPAQGQILRLLDNEVSGSGSNSLQELCGIESESGEDSDGDGEPPRRQPC